ncbi:MAG: DUF3320 domain-containing protein [Synergistes sp.]|nr:DUF3320 domain-containing protein [Synergistes sp.]
MTNSAAENYRVVFSFVPVINYALQQNRIPAVRRMIVVNDSDEPLEGADLKIEASPAFARPFLRRIELVPSHGSYEIKDPELVLCPEFLSALTEKCAGVLAVSLMRGTECLYSCDSRITVLAYDEWSGASAFPELLAAFVTPNHPEIAKITADASSLLEKWSGDPSIDGYQTHDPNRALAQAAAAFGALGRLGIAYASPPASFEKSGQRVRLADAVTAQKLGTCLDLSLLYCSCLEAMGLHPLIILKEDHAFAGVWLEDLSFPDTVTDDASFVTKRAAEGVNEIAVVECTLFTAGKNASFDDARAAASREMNDAASVECIIDVSRARQSGIVPLPLMAEKDGGAGTEEKEPCAPVLPPRQCTVTETESAEAQQPSKLAQWERKLLDLGLRNNLINMRLSQRVIPLLSFSPEALEDALSDGGDFSVLARPADIKADAGGVTFETLQASGTSEEFLRSEFKNRRLRAAIGEKDLSQAIKNLYRTAKTAAEENGANTLYLALGIVRWYETERSTKARYAPALLLPVEIVRRSANAGYVIRMRDDDPQINITLLEKLKQDFRITAAGLDPLPADEHGADVRKILTILRRAIMEQPRWDVLDAACLGIFSFSQFVMWNDIKNRADDLAKNKTVSSLISGRLTWDARDMEIGEKVDENTLLPLPADASQLFAIKAACAGESFVLHGPPGTGKSQSITALIAKALAEGKSVLFIAEKMAALEVVQRRLAKIGIGPFCLQLHSNKSRKKDVLEQLRRALEAGAASSGEKYERTSQRCSRLRGELDEYAAALHKRQKCGMSVYELVNEYEKYRNAPDIAPFTPEITEKLDADAIALQDSLSERLSAAARAAGHPHGHPLSGVRRASYSLQLKESVLPAAADYEKRLARMEAACAAFSKNSGFPEPSSLRDIEKAAEIAEELMLWCDMPKAWTAAEKSDEYLASVRGMARHFEKAGELKGALSRTWDESFFREDGKALLYELKEASSRWFVGKFFAMNRITKRISHCARTLPPENELAAHFERLASFQSENAAASALFRELGAGLEGLFRGEDTDWQALEKLAQSAARSAERLRTLCGGDSLRIRFSEGGAFAASVAAVKDAWEKLTEAKTALYSLLDIKESYGAGWFANQRMLCGNIKENADCLKEWTAWNAAASEAESAGLAPVVEACRGGLALEDIKSAFKKSLFKSLAARAIESSPALAGFSGALFNEKVDQLRRIDGELFDAAKEEIFRRLSARVPSSAKEAAQSSELGILQRAIRSGGRGMSIRRLFQQIPNLLPRLAPCMLMSPISAAQYLDPSREPFDLVVFDEASQLPTSRAAGALARGKNAVIVGDPNQMPPTSFFAVNMADEDNLEEEDLESVLDDCIALGMPQTHLLWHYRSRHESLIAFSNYRFYENRLRTFPSANDRETKVSLVHVNGVFDRGRTRQNRAEAEAVVEELKRRCHDAVLSKLSVGVVTFNIQQQNLIDDLLNEACKNDAELDRWAYSGEEPLFIKNLENVQGDERDVILFSVDYGPDENGRVHMNFGPLNRAGGWRRLNVAVSRSRCEMTVFATIAPEQIDTARTSSEGAAALKDFLEYAEGRPVLQRGGTETKRAGRASGIAEAICAALEEKGYETQRAIGRSGFRVDIGVADPDDKDRYMLGILLDGESYGGAKTTRDREIAQISVLQGLGWNITRVWTIDWWDNPGKEINRILAEIEKIKEKKAEKTEEEIAPETNTPEAEAQSSEVSQELPPDSAPDTQREEEANELPLYKAAEFERTAISAEEFLLPKYTAAIRARLLSVIEQEAPISGQLAARRVLQSFGISRAGGRIHARMDGIFSSLRLKRTRQEGADIYWSDSQDPESYSLFRAPANEASRRDAKDIPVQEAANAVLRVLEEQISMPEEDLVKEAAKLLGFARQGTALASLFADAVRYASAKGMITKSANGNLTLPS